MKHINILHLSDIHFKRKEKQTFRDDVEEKMRVTIKEHLEANDNALDFVAVTGDITFSGKEYDKAKAFFKTIKSVLPSETVVLPVPGNHDVDREAISKYFSLHNIVRDKETDGFLEDKKKLPSVSFLNLKTSGFSRMNYTRNSIPPKRIISG